MNRPIGRSALGIRSVAPAPLVVCGLCEGAQSLVGWRYVVWCSGREWRRRKRRGRETPEGEGRAAESTNRGCQQTSQSSMGRPPAGTGHRSELPVVLAQPPVSCQFTSADPVLATTPVDRNWKSGCTGLGGVATAQQELGWRGWGREAQEQARRVIIGRQRSSTCLHDQSCIQEHRSPSRDPLPDLDGFGRYILEGIQSANKPALIPLWTVP